MAICKLCHEDYSDKRRALGLQVCLECGDKAAQQEANRRRKCVAPAYNKGAYQYIGDLSDAFNAGK
jgi:ribosomal protein L37AE/L43A